MALKDLLPANLFEVFERVGISTAKQIVTLSIWDIKKYTNLNNNDIVFVKNLVADSLCPDFVTCNIVKRQKSTELTHVSTGSSVVDDLLRGGYRRGTLTEVFGESGCGKTQLALQAAVNNWKEGCFFICTEDLFPVKRFEEVKRGLPLFDIKIDYGKNVFVEHVTEASELLSCVSVRLVKLLSKQKISLVIIDSIAAPFRCETTNYLKRAEDLREIAIQLTEIAQKHNLAILCINQVTAAFDECSSLLPSLGLAWSNMISTRLMINKTEKQQLSSYVRELSVIFAPDLSNTSIEFVITGSGIKALKCSQY